MNTYCAPQLRDGKNGLMASLAALTLLAGIGPLASAPADYPVKPVPFTAVHVQDSFWTPRFETNRLRTVWYDYQKLRGNRPNRQLRQSRQTHARQP